jgi:hypothetical protein
MRDSILHITDEELDELEKCRVKTCTFCNDPEHKKDCLLCGKQLTTLPAPFPVVMME